MKEKLYIENFAGIKEAEIELNKINILIGPQATGKSVVAKLLYYFRELFDKMIYSVISLEDFDIYYNRCRESFNQYFPKYFNDYGNFTISYNFGELQFILKKEDDNYDVLQMSSELGDIYIEFLNHHKRLRYNEKPDLSDRNKTLNEISNYIIDKLKSSFTYQKSQQVFIPSGRSFVYSIKEGAFSLWDNINIDPFLKDFGVIHEGFSKYSGFYNKSFVDASNNIKKINNLCGIIISGSAKLKDSMVYIVHHDGRKVRINYASSGQQESLPLLETLFFAGSIASSQILYIEEPEAHIFPSTQKSIVDLLAMVYNIKPEKLQFFITTHSPYILTSFNNLMEAGIVEKKAKAAGDEEKLKKLYDIVPKEQILDPDDVNAYVMTHDEKEPVKSIKDKETGLIDGDEIDEVSNELSIGFDKLLDLEYE